MQQARHGTEAKGNRVNEGSASKQSGVFMFPHRDGSGAHDPGMGLIAITRARSAVVTSPCHRHHVTSPRFVATSCLNYSARPPSQFAPGKMANIRNICRQRRVSRIFFSAPTAGAIFCF
ncbi:unnamed protein product, partial [Nesidiocoris tenuis]